MTRREKIASILKFLIKYFSILFASAAAFFLCLAIIYWCFGEWLRSFLTEIQTQLVVGLPSIFALIAVFSFGMDKLMDADEKEGEKENG